MSALFSPPQDGSGNERDDPGGDTILAGTPVVVRRRAGLAALIGAAASAVAIAYLWRASQTMTVLDWSLCAVMALVAGYYLISLVDARTPLAVADDLGVRIRLGAEWRGLSWDGIKQVAVHPRRGLLRDGRIVFSPHSLGRAVDGLEGKAKRHASLNQKLYGAALAVPVGVMTRVSTSSQHSVVEQIAALSLGRAEVIEVVPDTHPSSESESGREPAPAPRQKIEATPETSPASKPWSRFERLREYARERAAAREAAKSARAAEITATADSASPSEVEEQTPDVVDPVVDPVLDPVLNPVLNPVLDPGVDPGEAAARADGAPDAVGSLGDRDTSERPTRRRILGGIATIVSRVGKSRSPGVDGETPDVPLDPAARATPHTDPGEDVTGTSELRTTRRALRAEVNYEMPSALGNAALDAAHEDDDRRGSLPESRELRRAGGVDLVFEPTGSGSTGRVHPISQLGDPVDAPVIGDFVTEPAYDPVIGPDLTAARTRLGLSVDELADRTRIRPHVIESIEVDDFAPCGGDFYARGHLRTLARVLGTDPAPFLAAFEDRYATAPVNARRVFEAELATGMRGSMRSTGSGPNWGLLIGVVLCLVLVWGVVRFFSAEPAELVQNPAPVLNGSAGLGTDPKPAGGSPASDPLPVTLVAAHADTQLVVRNGNGRIVFSGKLLLGQQKRLEVEPPVRVRATDAGALEVTVKGKDKGVLGVLGQPGNRTFG